MPRPRPLLRYARGAAVAFEFTGTIAAGALVGWWLDGRFGSTPWGIVTGTVAAAIGGFVRLLQVLRKFEAIDRSAGRGPGRYGTG